VADLLDLKKEIARGARESKKVASPHLKDTIDDIEICVMAINLLALKCMHALAHDNRLRVILSEKFPARDINLSGALLNICHTSIAINKLCLEGLDTQARILVRTLDERLMQIPILFSTEQNYREWHAAQTPEESKSAHYRVFAKKKSLIKKYQEIERELFGNEKDEESYKWHLENESFYSMAVHGASNAVLIGSFSFDFESEKVFPNILGRASSASVQTLRHCRFQILWFLLMLERLLEKFHEWTPDLSQDLDSQYAACISIAKATVPEWWSERA
jgi:hypothetical protein